MLLERLNGQLKCTRDVEDLNGKNIETEIIKQNNIRN